MVYAFGHIEAYTFRENLLTLEWQVKYKNKDYSTPKLSEG
jgi:hypothetical protein